MRRRRTTSARWISTGARRRGGGEVAAACGRARVGCRAGPARALSSRRNRRAERPCRGGTLVQALGRAGPPLGPVLPRLGAAKGDRRRAGSRSGAPVVREGRRCGAQERDGGACEELREGPGCADRRAEGEALERARGGGAMNLVIQGGRVAREDLSGVLAMVNANHVVELGPAAGRLTGVRESPLLEPLGAPRRLGFARPPGGGRHSPRA